MQLRPDHATLLDAVAQFLLSEVSASLEANKALQFRVLIAANLANVVANELRTEHARFEVVLREEANPSITDRFIAEGTLRLKDKTLHAEERAERMETAIKQLSQNIRRQVKRHRDLRRKRSTTRRLVGRAKGHEA